MKYQWHDQYLALLPDIDFRAKKRQHSVTQEEENLLKFHPSMAVQLESRKFWRFDHTEVAFKGLCFSENQASQVKFGTQFSSSLLFPTNNRGNQGEIIYRYSSPRLLCESPSMASQNRGTPNFILLWQFS